MKLPFPVLTSHKIVVTQYVTDHELILDLRNIIFPEDMGVNQSILQKVIFKNASCSWKLWDLCIAINSLDKETYC